MPKRTFSGIMLILLLISIAVLTFDFRTAKAWAGTVYIRADGSIDPVGAPIQRNGDIYTLTGNISSDADGIVVERDNMTLDGSGYTVEGTGALWRAGVMLSARSNVTIKNVEIRTFYYGIELDASSNNSIVGNILEQTMLYGKGNILLTDSNYNSIVGNNMTNCWVGIQLLSSHNNTISANNVTKHSTGIYFESSSNNTIYHNNFTTNDHQVQTYDSVNIWDDGYPSGGNRWSDYWGADSYSGPYQNETGSDNIGDTPYIIDENNADHYPFMYPRDPCEQQVVSLVNGTRAYDYDLELENIAFSHYAFRSSGSIGANETANWIKEKFESFGLEAWLEPFEFTTWDLLSKPSLIIDDDGNKDTTFDQTTISSFQCEHYSWPTPESGAFADLVILPLPEAAGYYEIGANPINTTAWNAVNTAGKIVLIGREVRWSFSWHSTYKSKLTSQPPAAVVYTWWYDWMSFTPPMFGSTGGRPISGLGSYYWDLKIPVGFVNYEDGLWIRNRESTTDVSANVSIRSVIGTGTHYNVVGRIGGFICPEKMIIVSGHYDTVMCSGFCDNGAGTAGILELARVFAEAVETGFYKPMYTILFIAFAGEELYLVGSTNYIKQHKSDMANINAVINLDCIGSDEFYVTETNSVNGFDLDQVVSEAAQDLGVLAAIEPPGGSDQESFRNPSLADSYYYQYWGLDAGISDAQPVQSSAMLISYPLLYSDEWYTGKPGWIHTEYDNSTSTSTLNWVEVADLEKHIKVAALSTVRTSPDAPPSPRNLAVVNVTPWKTIVGQTYYMCINVTIENQGGYYEYFNVTVYANTTIIATIEHITLRNATRTTITVIWNTAGWSKSNYTISTYAWAVPNETDTTDNTRFDGAVLVGVPCDVTSPTPGVPDGTCDMRDIGYLCTKFGTTPSSPNWDPNCDVTGFYPHFPDDIVDMRDIGEACSNFGETDP